MKQNINLNMNIPSIEYNFFRFNIVGVIMKSFMSGIINKCDKILRSIVISNFINVVDVFRSGKVSANFRFNYKTMFTNVTLTITKWMARIKNENISTTISHFFKLSSIFPVVMFNPPTSGFLKLWRMLRTFIGAIFSTMRKLIMVCFEFNITTHTCKFIKLAFFLFHIISISCFLTMSNCVWAQSITAPQHSNAPLNVTDGSTSCYPYQVSTSPGTLSCSNGIATLNTSGGGAGGSVGIGTVNAAAVYVGVSTVGPAANLYVVGNNVGVGTTFPGGALSVMSGNVGIGTWIPGQLFSVGNSFKVALAGGVTTNGNINTGGSVGAQTFQPNTSTGDIVFTKGDGSTELMRMANTNGNIGIGTALPQVKVDINEGTTSTVKSTLALRGTISAVNAGHSLDFIGGGANDGAAYARVAGVTDSVGGGGVLAFYTASTLGSATSTEKMRIDKTGNVGIGTLAPNGKLDVSGSAVVSAITDTTGLVANSGGKLSFYNQYNSAGSNQPYVSLQGIRENVNSASNSGALLFYVGANGSGGVLPEVMRINSSGNVGIGTTTPQFPLQVLGNVGIGTTGSSGIQQLVVNNEITFNREFNYASNIGVGTTNINWNNGNAQNIGIGTNGTNTYITFTHPTNGNYASLNLRILEDATGSRALPNWPATVLWCGGSIPTLSGANKSDIFTFKWNGATDFGCATSNF